MNGDYTNNKRSVLCSFIWDLSRSHPKATIAQAMALLLTARRLRSHPDEAEEAVTELHKIAPGFAVLAIDGVVTVNLNSTGEPVFDEYRIVPSF